MENGALFSSHVFIIDFGGLGGFLFHVIPYEIVGFSKVERIAGTSGPGGALSRYSGREVRPACLNPDPV